MVFVVVILGYLRGFDLVCGGGFLSLTVGVGVIVPFRLD